MEHDKQSPCWLQANKEDDAQPMIADSLEAFDPAGGAADVCVVGCGPAGLALAAELAANGIYVALVGRAPQDSRRAHHNQKPLSCSQYQSSTEVL